MESKETRRDAIDIYDADGVLNETVEGDYSGDELLQEISRVVSEDGIPVIRDKGKELSLEQLLNPEKRPLTMAWRVGNVSFHAEGASEDVAMRDLQFRAILPDLLATVKSRGMDPQTAGKNAE